MVRLWRKVMVVVVLGVVWPSLCTAVEPDGRAIYNFRCYFCHGYSGDAQTLAAQMLDPVPRDFTALAPGAVSRAHMIDAVANGRPGTAMKPFASLLSDHEIAAVVDFVRDEFMQRKAPNMRYHSLPNGWSDHERFAIAFPFVRGEVALSADQRELTAAQRAGRELYLSSCISCHDIARRGDTAPVWQSEAVSYPRTGFATGDFLDPPDAVTGATTFASHDIVPAVAGLSPSARHGESLFQANCAFCHAADGTGKNWIGTFMQPHPRDLTNTVFMRGMTRERLRSAIADGLPGTSMPAWAGVLSTEDIHGIVEYISAAFHPLVDGG